MFSSTRHKFTMLFIEEREVYFEDVGVTILLNIALLNNICSHNDLQTPQHSSSIPFTTPSTNGPMLRNLSPPILLCPAPATHTSVVGRLHLCSKNLYFLPDDTRIPILKFPLKSVSQYNVYNPDHDDEQLNDDRAFDPNNNNNNNDSNPPQQQQQQQQLLDLNTSKYPSSPYLFLTLSSIISFFPNNPHRSLSLDISNHGSEVVVFGTNGNLVQYQPLIKKLLDIEQIRTNSTPNLFFQQQQPRPSTPLTPSNQSRGGAEGDLVTPQFQSQQSPAQRSQQQQQKKPTTETFLGSFFGGFVFGNANQEKEKKDKQRLEAEARQKQRQKLQDEQSALAERQQKELSAPMISSDVLLDAFVSARQRSLPFDMTIVSGLHEQPLLTSVIYDQYYVYRMALLLGWEPPESMFFKKGSTEFNTNHLDNSYDDSNYNSTNPNQNSALNTQNPSPRSSPQSGRSNRSSPASSYNSLDFITPVIPIDSASLTVETIDRHIATIYQIGTRNNAVQLYNFARRFQSFFSKSRSGLEKTLSAPVIQAHLITPLVTVPGRILLTSEGLYYSPYNAIAANTYSIQLDSIVFIHKRRYTMRQVGLEFVMKQANSSYGGSYGPSDRNNSGDEQLVQNLFKNTTSIYLVVDNPFLRDLIYDIIIRQEGYQQHAHPSLEKCVRLWVEGKMANFDYLLLINHFSGRSLLDITQFPVFPWVLQDYTSSFIDFKDRGIYRDLSKPMGAQTPKRLESFQQRYKSMVEMKAIMEKESLNNNNNNNNPHEISNSRYLPDGNLNLQYLMSQPDPFMYGTHYSTPGYVVHWLLRSHPLYFLKLQSGSFDRPERLFSSISSSFKSSTLSPSDVRELIPQFYDTENVLVIPAGSANTAVTNSSSVHSTPIGGFLVNSLHLNLGTTQDGREISNVELPPWAHDEYDFICKMRMALESEIVSESLHHWIDLIFGSSQQGQEAIDNNNLFISLTYDGVVDLDLGVNEKDKALVETQINEFGQTPKKLFFRPHPPKYTPLQTIEFKSLLSNNHLSGSLMTISQAMGSSLLTAHKETNDPADPNSDSANASSDLNSSSTDDNVYNITNFSTFDDLDQVVVPISTKLLPKDRKSGRNKRDNQAVVNKSDGLDHNNKNNNTNNHLDGTPFDSFGSGLDRHVIPSPHKDASDGNNDLKLIVGDDEEEEDDFLRQIRPDGDSNHAKRTNRAPNGVQVDHDKKDDAILTTGHFNQPNTDQCLTESTIGNYLNDSDGGSNAMIPSNLAASCNIDTSSNVKRTPKKTYKFTQKTGTKGGKRSIGIGSDDFDNTTLDFNDLSVSTPNINLISANNLSTGVGAGGKTIDSINELGNDPLNNLSQTISLQQFEQPQQPQQQHQTQILSFSTSGFLNQDNQDPEGDNDAVLSMLNEPEQVPDHPAVPQQSDQNDGANATNTATTNSNPNSDPITTILNFSQPDPFAHLNHSSHDLTASQTMLSFATFATEQTPPQVVSVSEFVSPSFSAAFKSPTLNNNNKNNNNTNPNVPSATHSFLHDSASNASKHENNDMVVMEMTDEELFWSHHSTSKDRDPSTRSQLEQQQQRKSTLIDIDYTLTSSSSSSQRPLSGAVLTTTSASSQYGQEVVTQPNPPLEQGTAQRSPSSTTPINLTAASNDDDVTFVWSEAPHTHTIPVKLQQKLSIICSGSIYTLGITGTDSTLRVFDTHTLQLKRQTRISQLNLTACVLLDTDGVECMLGDSEGGLYVFNVDSSAILETFTTHHSSITQIHTTLLTRETIDGMVKGVRDGRGDIIGCGAATTETQFATISTIDPSYLSRPASILIATTGADYSVQLWELTRRVANVAGSGGSTSPPESLPCANNRGLNLTAAWTTSNYHLSSRDSILTHDTGLLTAAFSPDNLHIVTVDTDYLVHLTNVETGGEYSLDLTVALKQHQQQQQQQKNQSSDQTNTSANSEVGTGGISNTSKNAHSFGSIINNNNNNNSSFGGNNLHNRTNATAASIFFYQNNCLTSSQNNNNNNNLSDLMDCSNTYSFSYIIFIENDAIFINNSGAVDSILDISFQSISPSRFVVQSQQQQHQEQDQHNEIGQLDEDETQSGELTESSRNITIPATTANPSSNDDSAVAVVSVTTSGPSILVGYSNGFMRCYQHNQDLNATTEPLLCLWQKQISNSLLLFTQTIVSQQIPYINREIYRVLHQPITFDRSDGPTDDGDGTQTTQNYYTTYKHFYSILAMLYSSSSTSHRLCLFCPMTRRPEPKK